MFFFIYFQLFYSQLIQPITITMDSYPQLLLLFYRKVTLQHSKRIALIRLLHSLLQNINQQFLVKISNTNSESAMKKQDLLFDSVHRKKQLEYDSQLMRKGGEQWGCEWIFVSSKLQNTINFGILNILIYNENILSFKLLEEKLNIQLQQSGLAQETMRLIAQQWSRMGQILLNKQRVRWPQLLLQSVHKLPQQFHELVFALLTKNLKKEIDKEITVSEVIQSVSAETKMTIIYFQIEGKRILLTQKYGSGIDTIIIGRIVNINKYVISNKLPQMSQTIKQKLQILNELSINIDQLMKEYILGSAKLCQLSSLTSFKLKQQKILSYIQSTK